MDRSGKYENLYTEYLSGLSLAQVAKKYNLTRQSVYAAFVVRGYKLRTKNKRDSKVFDNLKFTKRNTGYYSHTIGDRSLMHRYIWQYHNGPIPDGYDVHHKDFDRSNNDINNLECLPKSEHTRLYSPHNNQYTKGRKIVGKCRL